MTEAVDFTSADNVQIVIKGDRVWVNVDGVCRFRAYRIKRLAMDLDAKTQQIINAATMPEDIVMSDEHIGRKTQ